MRWKIRTGSLACAVMLAAAGGAHAQLVTVDINAVALDEESIRVDFPDFDSAPICGSGPVVERFRDSVLENTDNLPLGDSTVTYSGLPGGTYYFFVQGCVLTQGQPEFGIGTSNSVTIDGAQVAVPAAPGTIDADVGDQGSVIAVSWSEAVGATHYELSSRTASVDEWDPDTADNWGAWGGFSNLGPMASVEYSNPVPAIYQYRVRACNVAGCSGSVISDAAIISPPQFDAGDTYYMADAKIRAIWTAPEGCHVLFENLPSACETKFSNAHALIQFENPNHEKMYSQVFYAKALGQRIDVWFDDNGDCGSLNTLMTIGRIEIKDDNNGGD